MKRQSWWIGSKNCFNSLTTVECHNKEWNPGFCFVQIQFEYQEKSVLKVAFDAIFGLHEIFSNCVFLFQKKQDDGRMNGYWSWDLKYYNFCFY